MTEEYLIKQNNGITYLEFKSLIEQDLRHAFTTRIGGNSLGYLSSQNYGLNSGDSIENVKNNLKLLINSLGIEKATIIRSRQLHSSEAYFITCDNLKDYKGKIQAGPIDSLVTDCNEFALLAIFADCIPVYLFDKTNRWVAIVHSGWKGTLDEIVVKTIEEARLKLAIDKENMIAVIGPGIEKCCFEIGLDVAEKMKVKFPQYVLKKSDEKYLADLKGMIGKSLLDYGVLYDNISVVPLCTCCRQDLFFSHRGSNGKTGRMAGIIKLKGDAK